ncbi:hypothetical protein D5086_007946 [Populus alba]|uniref:Uncharacterized protein n=1 Tax=Populus alba TaxID=43335 RepID=A0ACC4CDY4_POPAL
MPMAVLDAMLYRWVWLYDCIGQNLKRTTRDGQKLSKVNWVEVADENDTGVADRRVETAAHWLHTPIRMRSLNLLNRLLLLSLSIDGRRVADAWRSWRRDCGGFMCRSMLTMAIGQLDVSARMRETMVVVCGDAEIGYHVELLLA